jgi:hypothetical protein
MEQLASGYGVLLSPSQNLSSETLPQNLHLLNFLMEVKDLSAISALQVLRDR